MKKVILAEYYPRENRVSRIMYSFDERDDLYREFVKSTEIIDPYNQNIILMLDYDGTDKTFKEVEELCRKTLHEMTKGSEEDNVMYHAKKIKEFCKNKSGTCKGCIFHDKENTDWGCILDSYEEPCRWRI